MTEMVEDTEMENFKKKEKAEMDKHKEERDEWNSMTKEEQEASMGKTRGTTMEDIEYEKAQKRAEYDAETQAMMAADKLKLDQANRKRDSEREEAD